MRFSLTVLQLKHAMIFFASIPNNCDRGCSRRKGRVGIRVGISLKGSGGGVRRRMLKYRGVVRERVSFGAEMVDKETME
jgi:hypothetical protein